jgi:hypothetical protein
MLLTLKPIYRGLDPETDAFIASLIALHVDKRSVAYRTCKDDLYTLTASLMAYRGAKEFKVNKSLLSTSQSKAWDELKKAYVGPLLARESGLNVFSWKKDVAPSKYVVVNSTQRGIKYRIEGSGVQWTNLHDLEPHLVVNICGVRAAHIELLTVEHSFQMLLEGKRFPTRWRANSDLTDVAVTQEAIELTEEYEAFLNAHFERQGRIMGVKKNDSGNIDLVCANDVAGRINDLLADWSVRWWRENSLPQLAFPLLIKSGGLTSTFAGKPLTQLRQGNIQSLKAINEANHAAY